jgi:hypothetical protein
MLLINVNRWWMIPDNLLENMNISELNFAFPCAISKAINVTPERQIRTELRMRKDKGSAWLKFFHLRQGSLLSWEQVKHKATTNKNACQSLQANHGSGIYNNICIHIKI